MYCRIKVIQQICIQTFINNFKIIYYGLHFVKMIKSTKRGFVHVNKQIM